MNRSWFRAGLVGMAIASAVGLGSCDRPLAQGEAEEVAPTVGIATHKNAPTGHSEASTGELPTKSPATASPATAPDPAAPNTTAPASVAEAGETQNIKVEPPPSEVVPAGAKAAAASLGSTPALAVEIQTYSTDELFAAGSGGCGMSLWRAKDSYRDGSILFSGIGEGPQLLMKLNGKIVRFERIEGSGKAFYGQFAQQRFRNLSGDVEVMTDVELGAVGEIESVAIDRGLVRLTQNGIAQEIAVKGDAGC